MQDYINQIIDLLQSDMSIEEILEIMERRRKDEQAKMGTKDDPGSEN